MTLSNPVFIDYAPLTYKQKIQHGLYTFPKKFKQYTLSLFPILQWIHRYSLSVSTYLFKKKKSSLINTFFVHISGLFKMQLRGSRLECLLYLKV